MIAVDWGTSSLRVYRLGADGVVLDQRACSVGLLACQGRFEAQLAEQIAGWDDSLVVMAGMVGSRNGWHEVPYVACPAGLDEIAVGLLHVPAPGLPGRSVWIAPGLCDRPAGRAPEVMRGEETQVLGLLADLPGAGPHTVCLPGTHSKWVTLLGGRITTLRTAMTGEVYAVLRQHSILGAPTGGVAGVRSGEPTDGQAGGEAGGPPDRAFVLGLESAGAPGGLLNHLFSVRSRGLFGELAGDAAADYLSGLLIGHELAGLVDLDTARGSGAPVHLIGQPALVQRYVQALTWRGLAAQVHADVLVTRGLRALALQAVQLGRVDAASLRPAEPA